MSQRPVLVILLLALIMGGASVWLRSGPDVVPMTALVPAMLVPASETGPKEPCQPATAGGPTLAAQKEANDLPAATPIRQAVEGSSRPPELRDVAVQVTVLAADATPLPSVEVSLQAARDGRLEPSDDLQATGTDGVAHFTVPVPTAAAAVATAEPGAAEPGGRPIVVFCALGGKSRSVRLPAPRGDDTEPVRLTLQAVPRCFVEGMVVDASGHGIAAAELLFLPWASRSSNDPNSTPGAQRVGRTRSDGSFRIGLAQGGQLGAVHGELSPSALVLVQLDADRSLPPKTISARLVLMTRQARARGLVVDEAGAPIAGARLEFRAKASRSGTLAAAPQRCRSGPDGRFEVGNLLPGESTWAVRAPGFGGRRSQFAAAAGQTVELHLVLAAGAELHGRVLDSKGTAVAGARVQADLQDPFELDAATSAADGSFRLAGLPAGPLDVLATEAAKGTSAPRRARTRAELRAGEVAQWTAVLADPPQGLRLVGTVVDTAGQPLVGWQVAWIQDGRGARTMRTGPQGEFEFDHQGPRAAQLLVHAPDQPAAVFPDVYLPAVAPEASPLRIVVDRNAARATVRGLVQTGNQQPIAAAVSIWHHEMRRYARVEADQDGRFRIDRIPAGSIDLYVDHPGYAGFAQQSVPVLAGTDTDLGVLVLGAAAALHGTVIGPDGQPPEQLEIYILSKDQRLLAEYAGGTYRLGALPPGRHVLQVQGRGIAGVSFPIELEAGTERCQDIRLQTGVARRIQVMTTPAAGNFVSIAVRLPGQVHQWLSGQPRVDGGPTEFVAYMAPGTYEVLAWGAEGWQAQEKVVFAPGQEAAIRLILKQP